MQWKFTPVLLPMGIVRTKKRYTEEICIPHLFDFFEWWAFIYISPGNLRNLTQVNTMTMSSVWLIIIHYSLFNEFVDNEKNINDRRSTRVTVICLDTKYNNRIFVRHSSRCSRYSTYLKYSKRFETARQDVEKALLRGEENRRKIFSLLRGLWNSKIQPTNTNTSFPCCVADSRFHPLAACLHAGMQAWGRLVFCVGAHAISGVENGAGVWGEGGCGLWLVV